MEKIDKIIDEEIITKTSVLASDEEIELILKHIVKADDDAEKRVFNKQLDSDEKIDIFLFWKNMLIGIFKVHICTENYAYDLYSCHFLDKDVTAIDLRYIIHSSGVIEDVSTKLPC